MYEIVIELDLAKLQANVNKKIVDGFVPTGGVTVIPSYNIEEDTRFFVEAQLARQNEISSFFTAYAQAVVKS